MFDITAGVITATSDPAGRHTIGATGLLATPAQIRQLCHLTAGDLVVLLAQPGRDLLLIHPARTVARLHGFHQAAQARVQTLRDQLAMAEGFAGQIQEQVDRFAL